MDFAAGTHIVTVQQLKSHSRLWHVHIYSIVLFLILTWAIDARGFQVSFYPSRLLLLPFLVLWADTLNRLNSLRKKQSLHLYLCKKHSLGLQ